MAADRPSPGPASSSRLVGAPLVPTMLRLAVPGVIGALIQSAQMMVEAGFLRHVGTDALAAVAVVFPLVMLAGMFSAGAMGGAVAGATARALGAGDSGRASAVLAAAFVLALLAGCTMSVLVIGFGPALYAWAGTDPRIAAASTTYAAVVFAGMPMLWMSNMLSSVLRGSGDMLRPAGVMAVTLASYALYARWLIPGAGAPLHEAMRAAGLAMVLAYLSALLVAVGFVLRPAQPVRPRRHSFRKAVFGAVLRQGSLASTQSLMTVAYALVATALFSRQGTDWLAGYGLAVRLELLMVPVIFGVGSSLIAIVGAHVGAGLRARAVSIAWRGVLFNALMIGAVGLLFAIQPGWWCDTLASTSAVAADCRTSLRVIGPTYGFFALGLGIYFASQGLNTLPYPVTGALLRLLIVAGGLLWAGASTPPQHLLWLVASAVVAYGAFVAIALRLGPWRPEPRAKAR
ncbi:MAG: MATE family efflux transporter [Burkholderiaceae bacterium]